MFPHLELPLFNSFCEKIIAILEENHLKRNERTLGLLGDFIGSWVYDRRVYKMRDDIFEISFHAHQQLIMTMGRLTENVSQTEKRSEFL